MKSLKQEATENNEPIRLVTGINSSTNENRVGNIEADPMPISTTLNPKPISDELPELMKALQKIIQIIF